MSEAELKLTLFRWIDQLSGDRLKWLFKLLEKQLGPSAKPSSTGSLTPNLEEGYAAMAADKEREAEAMEWVENVLNHSDI